MPRIADDVKAIKAGLDRITGARPSGRHFDADGKPRETRFSDLYGAWSPLSALPAALDRAMKQINNMRRDMTFYGQGRPRTLKQAEFDQVVFGTPIFCTGPDDNGEFTVVEVWPKDKAPFVMFPRASVGDSLTITNDGVFPLTIRQDGRDTIVPPDRCMNYVGRPTSLCARKTCVVCDPWR